MIAKTFTEKQIFRDEKKAKKACKEDQNAKCFDCGTKIETNGDEIQNGSLLSYEDNGNNVFVFKCDSCFAKNEGVENYKQCEVYSRVVGYLRPVTQWNDGKKQEFKERKEYEVVEK